MSVIISRKMCDCGNDSNFLSDAESSGFLNEKGVESCEAFPDVKTKPYANKRLSKIQDGENYSYNRACNETIKATTYTAEDHSSETKCNEQTRECVEMEPSKSRMTDDRTTSTSNSTACDGSAFTINGVEDKLEIMVNIHNSARTSKIKVRITELTEQTEVEIANGEVSINSSSRSFIDSPLQERSNKTKYADTNVRSQKFTFRSDASVSNSDCTFKWEVVNASSLLRISCTDVVDNPENSISNTKSFPDSYANNLEMSILKQKVTHEDEKLQGLKCRNAFQNEPRECYRISPLVAASQTNKSVSEDSNRKGSFCENVEVPKCIPNIENSIKTCINLEDKEELDETCGNCKESIKLLAGSTIGDLADELKQPSMINGTAKPSNGREVGRSPTTEDCVSASDPTELSNSMMYEKPERETTESIDIKLNPSSGTVAPTPNSETSEGDLCQLVKECDSDQTELSLTCPTTKPENCDDERDSLPATRNPCSVTKSLLTAMKSALQDDLPFKTDDTSEEFLYLEHADNGVGPKLVQCPVTQELISTVKAALQQNVEELSRCDEKIQLKPKIRKPVKNNNNNNDVLCETGLDFVDSGICDAISDAVCDAAPVCMS